MFNKHLFMKNGTGSLSWEVQSDSESEILEENQQSNICHKPLEQRGTDRSEHLSSNGADENFQPCETWNLTPIYDKYWPCFMFGMHWTMWRNFEIPRARGNEFQLISFVAAYVSSVFLTESTNLSQTCLKRFVHFCVVENLLKMCIFWTKNRFNCQH